MLMCNGVNNLNTTDLEIGKTCYEGLTYFVIICELLWPMMSVLMMTLWKTVKSVAAYKIVFLFSNTIYHGFFINLHDNEAAASHSFLPFHENCPFPFLLSSPSPKTNKYNFVILPLTQLSVLRF